MNSMLGMIMLCGVAVNNSILIIANLRERLEEGLTKKDAIIAAANDRMLAIIMTTATTVFAMIPISQPMKVFRLFVCHGAVVIVCP